MGEIYYIFSHGNLKKRQNTLYLENKDGKGVYIPIEKVDSIYAFGEITLNKRLLEFLSRKGILLHLFNYYGYYIGTFYPREHLCSGHLILKQVEYYLDKYERLILAKKFVEGAIKNILKNLQYYSNRKRKLKKSILTIKKYFSMIKKVNNIEKLMGLEGNMREVYYSSFNKILKNIEFSFEKRSKRPPENKVNALISFGNSLLYAEILSEIYKTHLDPRIGFLHATNFRRFSLNLDLAEIFKPIIIDRIIFKLILKNMITKNDFCNELGGIILNDKGKRVFIKTFEDKLSTTIYHRQLKRRVSFKQLIKLELYKLEKHLMGIKEYKPFVMWW